MKSEWVGSILALKKNCLDQHQHITFDFKPTKAIEEMPILG
jgi:hypothetical protein